MTALANTTDYDFGTGLIRLAFHGDLDRLGASHLRSAVLKALCEHPVAALVDLNQVTVVDELGLLVLLALIRRHSDIPVLVCARSRTPTGEAVRETLHGVSVFDSDQAAVQTLGGEGTSGRRAHVHLSPDTSAPVVARRLVVKVCQTWSLQHLTPIAELIISELVTNVVRHCGTDMEVTIAVGQSYLHLYVRDRTKRLPSLSSYDSMRIDHSRGLKLVDRLATGWGTTITPYGKTVWATLRLKPAT